MNRKTAHFAAFDVMRYPVLISLLFSILMSWFVFAQPSFAKFVINSTYNSLAVNSAAAINITAIGEISGTAQVEQTLTAGALTPSRATATYQWQRCTTANGVYTDISGAISSTYTLTADDYNCYLKVVATGTGAYAGTVTSGYTSAVVAGTITDIADIVGTTQVGQTLTAGILTPVGATATYQWQRSDPSDVTYTNIAGATSNTYTVTGADNYCYLRVVATGTGAYTGTVTSARTTARVSSTSTPIETIGAISGTAQVGETLTAGTLTPFDATVTYQWQKCATANGTYTDILGATLNTYALTSDEYNYYIRIVVTGSGSYTGTLTSAYIGPVEAGVITAIGNIVGTTQVGQILTAGSLTPANATATYQWQKCATANGTYTDISGATSSTYKLTSADNSYYIKVVATGTGNYTGTATSAYAGPVVTTVTPITEMGAISGTAQVGQPLTAGAITPAGATVTYQWQKCATADGTYANISGAISSTYTLTPNDHNYYIRVVATGSNAYSGILTSAYIGPVAACPITGISQILGTTAPGYTLRAGTVYPSGATVTYQWQYSDAGNEGIYTDIPGATSDTYYIQNLEYSYRYIRVMVTGTGAYTGAVISAPTTSRISRDVTTITAIGNISGTAQIGQTLTAGALTPSGATATYQWQSCDTSGGTYTNISGAISSTYTLTTGDYNKYIKVVATGAGAYDGTVTSIHTGPVAAYPITSIGNIGGTAEVGQILTAGAITPSGATVTYQWQSCDTSDGTFTNISGATSSTYTLAAGDLGKYIKVVATGGGYYSGTATSAYVGPVTTVITAVGNIIGIAQVENTLTAGALSPTGATATYQWQSCDTPDGTYTNISGATSNTYILAAGDCTKYIRVVVTGTGSYTGTIISAYVGPVAACPITAIGNISGSAQVSQTLTAGAVTPSGATVTYQWQSCDTPDGIYTNISGAISNTYVLAAGDYGKYIKVVATGTGGYSGTATSAYIGAVTTCPITAIGNISGSAQVGQTLTAGAITPSGATVTYQWQSCDTPDGTYTNISGATSSTYTLAAGDYGKYIKIVATGTGAYTGTAASAYVGPVTASITAIGNISGTAQVGQTLTAGAVTPSGATVTYQWQSCDTAGGTYTNISGATSSTYTLVAGDYNKYIKVVATGTGGYSGTVTSAYVGAVTACPITAIGNISGTAQVGQTLTAGALTPSGATVTYQWQSCSTYNGTYTNISGATSSTYTLVASDYNKYIKVVATGTGAYSGTITSAYVGAVTACPITAIGNISGNVRVGQTLTAGAITPAGATVTYQWQSCSTYNGTYTNISGATSSTYTLAASDNTKYIRVVATGTGGYSGTATSAYVGPVLTTINIAAITGVTAPVKGATPDTTVNATAQYTATITWSPSASKFATKTIYTATITITPKAGYTLTGVPANFFTVAGATTVTNSADSGVVTAVFPRTN